MPLAHSCCRLTHIAIIFTFATKTSTLESAFWKSRTTGTFSLLFSVYGTKIEPKVQWTDSQRARALACEQQCNYPQGLSPEFAHCIM